MYGYEERREESTWTVKKIMKWAGAVLGAIILLVLIFSGIYSISPGYRGVLVTLGKVDQKSYVNGVGFKWPIISSMIEMANGRIGVYFYLRSESGKRSYPL